MDINEKIEYWVKISENDIVVMEHLFDSGDYSYSLFIGHLVLEKILKAHFVKLKEETPPRIHDLLKLANQLSIDFSDDQLKFLIEANSFNIEARYPEEKLNFHKILQKNLLIQISVKSRKYIYG